MSERPWDLLADAGVPRPLPPETRARLEALLLDHAEPAEVPELAGIDAPRPLPTDLRGRLEALLPSRRRTGLPVWLAAAVAVVAVGSAVVWWPHSGHSPQLAIEQSTPSPSAPESDTASGALGSAVGVAPSASSPPVTPTTTPRSRPTASGLAAAPALVPSPAATRPVAPRVTGVSPSHGPTTGGTWVTVTGAALARVTRVEFGSGAQAARVQVLSDHEIRALSPMHLPGQVDILVTTPGGTSAVSPSDRYLFLT